MTDFKPNTEAYERNVVIDSNGFREYDARWLYPEQLNLKGVQHLGMGIGTLIHEMGKKPEIAVGHDYRSYSSAIKCALMTGLMASGCHVKDIGLALSPVAYFSQFDLDCQAVAMVTASHNENGWTGVKMGVERPLTFGPDEMSRLKEIVLNQNFDLRGGGQYTEINDIKERYLNDVLKDGPIGRKIKAVVACGNGTAGAYAPEALERLGCEVIPMDCELDYTFPRYNPNPEDLEMLHALSARVKETGADVGFAFDGDGDRCGVVDNQGREIFADKVGVMLARDLGKVHDKPVFVVDVKSTGLYNSDPVLQELGVKTDYWKTGHSYIKRRVNELQALAGFEKSGHFFLNAPIGRGYDDGILSAVLVCRLLDRAGETELSTLYDALPKTWSSPTMSPKCADEQKYGVVKQAVEYYTQKKVEQADVAGQKITDIVTVNGVRLTLEDGTWGLIRASSNKPSLVVVVESPVSESRMHDMFEEIDGFLSSRGNVGDYDQRIKRAA